MTFFDSLILGLVEGFTEFLPISSTAHLTLTSYLLGLDQSAFIKTFEIAIQSGAMLAVIAVYWRKFLDLEILKKLLAAFIPTAIVGFILYKLIKQYLIGNIAVTLWALAVGGLILILFEKFFKHEESVSIKEIKELSYKKASMIGLAQAIAVIPGVSRSAATIVGGLFVGMERSLIVEFSFLLAVPTILAATALDVFKNFGAFSLSDTGFMGIGFFSAFVTAILGIRFLLSYIKTRSFAGFGVYRVLLVLIFAIIFL